MLALSACSTGDNRPGPVEGMDPGGGSDGSGTGGTGTGTGSGSSGDSVQLGASDAGDHAVSELGFTDADTAMAKIANHGSAASRPLVATITGDGSADFVIDAASTCADHALAPGDSCSVQVRYQPVTDAVRSATLRVDDGDGDGHHVDVVLRPAGPRLVIRVAGGGIGEVLVSDAITGEALTTCTHSCVLRPAPGQLEIAAATPSIYGGLSGACTTTSSSCEVTITDRITIVTATFTTDPKEQWTRLPGGGAIASAAFDGSGNLIVASNGITKLSPTGAVVWQIPLAPCAVATGPGDTIYAETTTAVTRLTPGGDAIWSQPLDPVAVGCGSVIEGFVHNLAVGSDGAVAIHGDRGVARWDGDGNLTWALAVASLGEYGVAIEPEGVVDVAVLTDEPIDLVRFSASGAPLDGISHITSQYHGMFVVDATGRLLATASGHSHTDALGHSVRLVTDPDYAPNGICAAGVDDVAWIYQADDGLFAFAREWTVNRYHGNGDLAWTYHVVPEASVYEALGTMPMDIAGAPDGRIAIVGSFTGPTYAGGWIATFAP